MLDQPVPNPLAKNPNFFTHKVVAAVGLILVGTIAVLFGLALIYHVNIADLFNTAPAADNTKVGTSSAKPNTATTSEDTTNWKTYSSMGVSFKYPSTWTIAESKDKYGSSYASVTSPKGFVLYFSPELTGRGGGCAPDAPEMVSVNVYSIKDAGFKSITGKTVSIVEWGLSGGYLKANGSNYVRKEIEISESRDFPKLGDNGQNCLVYANDTEGELGFSSKTNYDTTFKGGYPDSSQYQQMSANDYFSLPDVKTAETIFSSVTY